MKKTTLLDLFCGAGGATKGYQDAGFYVVGIDNKPQPHYCGDKFVQTDALDFLDKHGEEYDLIHASPPCQLYSAMTNGRWQDRLSEHVDLIEPTRNLLIKTKIPYIIENVGGAAKRLINPIMLCGTMFGLETEEGNQLRRHRYFECSFSISVPMSCNHNKLSAIGVYGGGQHPQRRRGSDYFGVNARRKVMGISWMSGKEMSQAIPPAYTKYIGDWYIKNCITKFFGTDDAVVHAHIIIEKYSKSYPEDAWFSVGCNWDLNLYLDMDNQPAATLFPVVNGETKTDVWKDIVIERK